MGWREGGIPRKSFFHPDDNTVSKETGGRRIIYIMLYDETQFLPLSSPILCHKIKAPADRSFGAFLRIFLFNRFSPNTGLFTPNSAPIAIGRKIMI